MVSETERPSAGDLKKGEDRGLKKIESQAEKRDKIRTSARWAKFALRWTYGLFVVGWVGFLGYLLCDFRSFDSPSSPYIAIACIGSATTLLGIGLAGVFGKRLKRKDLLRQIRDLLELIKTKENG